MRNKTKSFILASLKVFFLLVVVGLGVFARLCFKQAAHADQQLSELRMPVLELPVDLSKTGTVSANLPAVENYAHGLGSWILPDTPKQGEELVAAASDGLEGSIVVLDDKRAIVSKFSFDEMQEADYPFWSDDMDTPCPALTSRLGYLEGSGYTVQVVVSRGSEQLKGTGQYLVVNYRLCGLEQWLVQVTRIVGAVSAFIAFLILLFIAISFIRKRNKPNASSPRAAGGA